ncbi:MAG TPA: FeoA family protein [bacterium]|nr:FeoA family protein [bacterium]
MTLADAGSGDNVRVVEIKAGRSLRGRLLGMGIMPGSEVRVLSGGRGGPVIIAQNDCRMALGQGMSKRIVVSRMDPDARTAG